MRIAIGAFSHESHSFSKDTVDIQAMRQVLFDDKDEIIENHRGVRGDGGGGWLGGYIDYAEARGWDIVPIFAAGAYPSGPVTRETYAYIKNKFIKNLTGEQVDGVLLHLHGACCVQGLDDAEGDLLTEIRNIVGERVPVLTVLDLHANVSELMVEKANAIYGYDTYPHMDVYEREQEACQLLEKIVLSKVTKPVMYRTQPPLLFPAIYTQTKGGPMEKLMEKAAAYEQEEKVINVSPFAGYYASDKREAGPSCVVLTDNAPELAEKIAKEMATCIWELQDEFFCDLPPIKEAIRQAEETEGLWAFVDECDDPLGGGSADGTYILNALMGSGLRPAGVSTIRDPEIVSQAWKAGIGGRVQGPLGVKVDKLHGEPVEINATVKLLVEREIPMADADPTSRQNVGKIAVLDHDGITIVVTELKAATEMMNIFKCLGIDITGYKALLLKGFGKAYEEVYKGIADHYIVPDSLGITSPDVRKAGHFTKIRRPVYPLDEEVDFRYE